MAGSTSVPGIVTSTTYEPDGQTRLMSYANGVSTSFSYDPERRWVTQIKTAKSATTLQQLDYAHDDVGRITTVISSLPSETRIYELRQSRPADRRRQPRRHRLRPDFAL